VERLTAVNVKRLVIGSTSSAINGEPANLHGVIPL
jgi:hypothetical protein